MEVKMGDVHLKSYHKILKIETAGARPISPFGKLRHELPDTRIRTFKHCWTSRKHWPEVFLSLVGIDRVWEVGICVR